MNFPNRKKLDFGFFHKIQGILRKYFLKNIVQIPLILYNRNSFLCLNRQIVVEFTLRKIREF